MRPLMYVIGLAMGIVVANAQANAQAGASAPVTDPTRLGSLPLTVTPVVEGLDAPWGVSWLPNGDMLITEKFGTLRLVRDGKLHSPPLPGMPDVYSGGQGGLLDIAPHPDFEANRQIYFSYAHGNQSANRLKVARATLANDQVSNVEVVFEVAQAKNGGQHFGSRLLWLPDNTLLVAIGDGGNPPLALNGQLIRELAQDLSAHFGKVIRIQPDGTAPKNNPFAAQADALAEIWSYGHRNIQGLARDPRSGRVYASEHGAQGGDELNLITPGDNYGWPKATHSVEYGAAKKPISPHKSVTGMVDPLAIWTPAIAPSGLALYSGDRYPDWKGDLFAGALRIAGRPNPGALLRLELDDSGQIIGHQRFDLGEVRVRDVRQGPDGLLYLLTTSTKGFNEPGAKNGVLWRIEPASGNGS